MELQKRSDQILYSTYLKWSASFPTFEKGVIVGADVTQEWLLPWWWYHYHKWNATPVTFIDFGMSEEAKQWCQKRGTLRRLPVADIYVAGKEEIQPSLAQEWENIYGREFWNQRNGWFKKPLACLLSPYRKSIWIDLDCEVRSSLEELFTFCEHPSGVALAKDIYEGYNSGVIAYQHGIPLMEMWAHQTFENNHIYAGDQDILTKILKIQKKTIADLPLIYNWSRCKGENPEAKIFHWHGRHGKTVISASPHLGF